MLKYCFLTFSAQVLLTTLIIPSFVFCTIQRFSLYVIRRERFILLQHKFFIFNINHSIFLCFVISSLCYKKSILHPSAQVLSITLPIFCVLHNMFSLKVVFISQQLIHHSCVFQIQGFLSFYVTRRLVLHFSAHSGLFLNFWFCCEIITGL